MVNRSSNVALMFSESNFFFYWETHNQILYKLIKQYKENRNIKCQMFLRVEMRSQDTNDIFIYLIFIFH